MRVLIVGAGALGIGIGASIRVSGGEVDFIARGENYTEIKNNGIKRIGYFNDVEIPAGEVGVYETMCNAPRGEYDYVIISTKTIANASVSAELNENSEIMKPEGCIVFMQNGLGFDKSFLQYFDKSKIYHSRVITGFKKDAPNISVITAHQAPVLIGSLYENDLSVVEPLASAINKSGLPSEVSTEIEMALWAKLIYNTTLNPLGAILNKSYGELADCEYSHSIMDKLIDESFDIMKVCGAKTYWDSADEYRNVLFNEMLPVTKEHRSSTLQDIEAKRKTEIDTLTGVLLDYAENYNVAAPVHRVIYSLIKAMEENF